MKFALTTTTINVPQLLTDYARDAKKFGHEISIIVIGDKKSPREARHFCESLGAAEQITTIYSDVADQAAYMERFPELDKFLPWNCVQRRNVAILMAYEQGADVIVMIDDDNFLAQDNYMSGHAAVGRETRFTTIHSDSGWFNICSFLTEEQGRKFYPRGYPVTQRSLDQAATEKQTTGRVVVNGGLWLGDPDIDAVTRLCAPINVTRYTRSDNFALAKHTWAPFNSQNTAIHRDCVPGYFLCSDIGRFDDIWASYVIQRLADHLGDYLSFGLPLVKQVRNPHDLWHDADLERFGMQLTDIFCEWLRNTHLTGRDYGSACVELIEGLKLRLDAASLSYAHRGYINHFIDGYRVWAKTMGRAQDNLA